MTKCRWCGMIHEAICPKVKAIEYNGDGTVKRVEFFAPNDYAPRWGTDPAPRMWPDGMPPGVSYAFGGRPFPVATSRGGGPDTTAVAVHG